MQRRPPIEESLAVVRRERAELEFALRHVLGAIAMPHEHEDLHAVGKSPEQTLRGLLRPSAATEEPLHG